MILGHLVSDVITRVTDSFNNPFECVNTEMMCRAIQDNNEVMFSAGLTGDKITIGSMDGIGLYPSLKLEETLAIVQEMTRNSNLTFDFLSFGHFRYLTSISLLYKYVSLISNHQFILYRHKYC